MKPQIRREFCARCAIKHLAQARALILEVSKGYPHHVWYAIGHMAEAEDEIVELMPDEAGKIRERRLRLEHLFQERQERLLQVQHLLLVGLVQQQLLNHWLYRLDLYPHCASQLWEQVLFLHHPVPQPTYVRYLPFLLQIGLNNV